MANDRATGKRDELLGGGGAGCGGVTAAGPGREKNGGDTHDGAGMGGGAAHVKPVRTVQANFLPLSGRSEENGLRFHV
ncbi:hypothetical protein EMQ_1320 [Acetobacter aceti NBRC 14818]|uniref:Uncharacterized protein n=1 Tax=Acetobacter aceti NBRC 14818 TaxID=887700 RepID=A0AB33IF53_ACEAC|nr:hypothetical protein EMQ_1320 [Acetobacter aceti NBRC 14818]GAN57893.1 hypothetical protein Abac_022_026 [Acetobacter aceti NBRC 14818]